MKVYFVGDLKTPFIGQDLALLCESNEVDVFDLAIHKSAFWQCPKYLLDTFLEWSRIKDSDIVYIWFADYPSLPFLVWAKVFGKPLVVNIGGWEVSGDVQTNYGCQLSSLRGLIAREIIRWSTVNIVPSLAYKKQTLSLVPSAIAKVIPNWVDEQLTTCEIPEKKNMVVTACCAPGAEASKGVPMFREAARNLPCKSLILGGVPRSEYERVLKESKVYVQLSYNEAFGVSLLEAMACGCIPVVSNRGALPWVVGGLGFVVPYGDVDKARAAISAALTVSGKDIESVRSRAKYFSKERKKKLQQDLLESLCEPKK